MNACFFNGPLEFEPREVPHPGAPAAGEVLIRVKYSGICGSDLKPYKHGVPSPQVGGHEVGAVVEALGEGVRGLSEGDVVAVNPLRPCKQCRLCLAGRPQLCLNLKIVGEGFADYWRLPAENCHRVTEALLAALVEPLACSIRAAAQARVTLGDTVVIFGAGPIGQFAMKAAQWMGAGRCLLVDLNENRLRLGQVWGAGETVNSGKVDPVQTIKDLTGGSVQRVIDAVGVPETHAQALAVIENGGRICTIGLAGDGAPFSGMGIFREIEWVGSACYTPSDFAKAIHCLEQKRIVPDPTWLDIRPMAQGKTAFDAQLGGRYEYLKTLLTPEPGPSRP